MKEISKIIPSILLIILFIFPAFMPSGLAQDFGITQGLPEPPVEMQFSLENAPTIDNEIILRLKINVLEDMHGDISCLLPEGVELIKEEGIRVRPYEDRFEVDLQRQMNYALAVELWVGPLTKGTIKEFIFRVKIHEKKEYEFIARVEALAKWGVKEEVLLADVR